MRSLKAALLLSAAIVTSNLSGAHAEETIRIAFIEGLCGAFANVGEISLRHYQIATRASKAKIR